jgi:hypothetical protein
MEFTVNKLNMSLLFDIHQALRNILTAPEVYEQTTHLN